MKTALKYVAPIVFLTQMAWGQSPSMQVTTTVGGKTLTVKYSAPSVRGRQIFGDSGVVSHDKTYPVWRAGANRATTFHTDADLDVGGLNVPAGDYTLFVLVKDPEAWELIVNKQTGQWGLTYKEDQDLGRVKMAMSKPAAPVETLKYSLSDEGANKAKLTMEWENHVASAPITVK